jgi:hypothetical protein
VTRRFSLATITVEALRLEPAAIEHLSAFVRPNDTHRRTRVSVPDSSRRGSRRRRRRDRGALAHVPVPDAHGTAHCVPPAPAVPGPWKWILY